MAPAALLALASAFNLSCDLRATIGVGKESATMESRLELRIDLAAMRWCEYECYETKPVQAATETTLTLIDDKSPDTGYEMFTISRETGRYDHRNYWRDTYFLRTGKCEPRPFSGFPKQRF